MITPLQLHAAELAEVYHVPLDEEKKQASEATEESKLAQEPVVEKPLSLSAGPLQSPESAAPESQSQSETDTEQRAPAEKVEQLDASAAGAGGKSEAEPEPEAVASSKPQPQPQPQPARSGAGDSYRCALQLSYVLEVLTFCAEHHAHTTTFKNFLIGRNFLPKCLPPLFHSRHTFLLLGALRFSHLIY